MPQIENGRFHYALMGIVFASESDSGWFTEKKSLNTFPASSTETSAATFSAFEKLKVKSMKSELKAQQESLIWTAGPFNLE